MFFISSNNSFFVFDLGFPVLVEPLNIFILNFNAIFCNSFTSIVDLRFSLISIISFFVNFSVLIKVELLSLFSLFSLFITNISFFLFFFFFYFKLLLSTASETCKAKSSFVENS